MPRTYQDFVVEKWRATKFTPLSPRDQTEDEHIAAIESYRRDVMPSEEEAFSCYTNATPDSDGGRELLFSMYVHEAWASECGDPRVLKACDTAALVDAALDDDNVAAFHTAASAFWPDAAARERVRLKIRNLRKAVFYLHTAYHRKISVEMIKHMHALVYAGLGDAGEIRTVDVAPSNSSVMYAPVKRIAERLDYLVLFYNSAAASLPASDIRSRVRLASVFFRELLLIHPFRNGNGRTARLLLSHLLRRLTVVPFSLYCWGSAADARAEYLDVLELDNDAPPSHIAFFVLKCIRRALYQYVYLQADV